MESESLDRHVSFDLAPDNSALLRLNETNSVEPTISEPLTESLTRHLIASEARDVLKKVRYQLPLAMAHANVRKVEQRKLLEMLSGARACLGWLQNGGMGTTASYRA